MALLTTTAVFCSCFLQMIDFKVAVKGLNGLQSQLTENQVVKQVWENPISGYTVLKTANVHSIS